MKLVTLQQKIFIRFRRRRMKMFYALFAPTRDTRVLDIGGAPNTWLTESASSIDSPITLVNEVFPDPEAFTNSRFTAIEGDATNLPFEDAAFDLAFSNSVIEHMTTWERQQQFASEARRVATRLWIQTPARSFPIEPHLLSPFFQHFSRKTQTRIARHFTLWGFLTKPTPQEIDNMLSDIRLLTFREFQQLFPDCDILKERILGVTKSYIAVRGALPPRP